MAEESLIKKLLDVPPLFESNRDDAEEYYGEEFDSASIPLSLSTHSTVTLPNFSENVLIFQIQGLISSIEKSSFSVDFLNFPRLDASQKPFVLTFPMSPKSLGLSDKLLKITGVQDDEEKTCTIDLTEQIMSLCEELNKTNPEYPIACQLDDEDAQLINSDGEHSGDLQVQIKIECIGPTILGVSNKFQNILANSDVDQENSRSHCSGEPAPSTDDDENYDEYTANINGHSFNVRMLKKEKPMRCQGKDVRVCDEKSAMVGRSDSQIVFQMPPGRSLCKQGQKNAATYNVKSCPDEQHGHGAAEAIKIMSGSSSEVLDDGTDSFCIVIGKKNSNGKGRLELKLKAPKPVTADDFKKPTRDAGNQTAPEEKSAKKAGKKSTKGKK